MAKVAKSPLQKHIDTLVGKYGGLRPAARALSLDPGYLWKLRRGHKTTPGANTLEKLGLQRVEMIKPLLGKPCG